MKVYALRTAVFLPGQNLEDFIFQNAGKHLKERSLLVISSKIVSLSEGRLCSKKNTDKKKLIQKECEYYLGNIGFNSHLTIHHGLFIPSAGIDESNSPTGDYILYPKNPFASVDKLRKALKKKTGLKKLALILADSRTLPLRRGTVGTALAWSGFKALKNLIGKKDLFGKTLRMSTMNLADALASTAVLLMGEGAEQSPLALIEEAPLEFKEKTQLKDLHIPVTEDLYYPLYQDKISRPKKKEGK